MIKIFTKIVGISSLCLFLCLVLLFTAPLGTLAGETIKIAQLDPFSGPASMYAKRIHAFFKFTVDEQNAKGGLLGKKIELITEDNEYKPDVAIRKAKKLILKDKVDFIYTSMGSHIAVALNKVATSYKKVILVTGTSDQVTGKAFSRYSFRPCQSIHQIASGLAQLCAAKPWKRFYLIGPDYSFGHDFAKVFKSELKKYVPDAEIVGEDYHPLGCKDFGPYVTKMIASKADCIFASNFGMDAIILSRTIRSMGLKAPFPIVSYGMSDPIITGPLGDQAEGIYSCGCYSIAVDTPENKEFVARWHAKHKDNKDPLLWWPISASGASYMFGLKMLFAAVEKAGTTETEKVIAAFEGLRYKTPVGEWYMRPCDHQAIIPMFALEIKAGWNPWFNGSIRKDVKYPFVGKVVKIPADKVALPATPEYNPRCQ